MNLNVSRISLKYDDNLIFKNLSFSASDGDILAIKGDNGSGKTSICLCLSGLLDIEADNVAYRGDIFYEDKEIKEMSVLEKANSVGIIFQNPDNQIFSPLVIEELAFAPENLALPREEILKRIDESLDICQISHLKNSKTNSLSGGEKQLVAIASVLTMRPKVLIADEITARIDMDKKELVRNILKQYAEDGGIVIMISHSQKDLEIANKVIEITRGKNYEN